MKNDPPIIRSLLEHGAKIEDRAYLSGQTPLHLACSDGAERAALALIKAGADLEARTVPQYLDPGAANETPLHLAVKMQKSQIVDTLLEKGAKVDPVDSFGRTPLHLAAGSHSHAIAIPLILKGAKLGQKDKEGMSPSALFRRPQAQHLSDHFRPLPHWILLHFADANEEEQKRFRTCFEICLKEEGEIMGKDWYGNSPMHIAAAANQPWAIKVLLKSGAKTEARNSCGDTPLHIAARNGNLDVLKQLLAAGANPLVRNCYGHTPLNIPQDEQLGDADENTRLEINKLLLKKMMEK